MIPADRKWFPRTAWAVSPTRSSRSTRSPDRRRRRPCAISRALGQELEAEALKGAAPHPFAAAHDGHRKLLSQRTQGARSRRATGTPDVTWSAEIRQAKGGHESTHRRRPT